MRCLFYSYCEEPKYLCCNFCSDKKCDKRCFDNYRNCKFYEKGEVDIDENKLNHIIRVKYKRSVGEVTASDNQLEKKDVSITKSSKSKNQSSKSTSETKSNSMKSKSTAKSKGEKQNSNTKIGEKISLF